MPGNVEAALTKALEDWRDETAKEWLGEESYDLHGASPVMPDEVLDDVVKYASKRKLLTVESLRVQARWGRSHKFGAQVLEIVNAYIPQPAADTDDSGLRPLASSTGIFINYGAESVSRPLCCKVDCMISMNFTTFIAIYSSLY